MLKNEFRYTLRLSEYWKRVSRCLQLEGCKQQRTETKNSKQNDFNLDIMLENQPKSINNGLMKLYNKSKGKKLENLWKNIKHELLQHGVSGCWKKHPDSWKTYPDAMKRHPDAFIFQTQKRWIERCWTKIFQFYTTPFK